MSLKGKENKNEVLEKLLRILWVGDADGAIKYLQNLSSTIIKNEKWLEEQISYLERKKEMIKCYAVRAKLGLRNSSNSVEKENDMVWSRENIFYNIWRQTFRSVCLKFPLLLKNPTAQVERFYKKKKIRI